MEYYQDKTFDPLNLAGALREVHRIYANFFNGFTIIAINSTLADPALFPKKENPPHPRNPCLSASNFPKAKGTNYIQSFEPTSSAITQSTSKPRPRSKAAA
jgi:hypothetical protein